MTIWEDLGLDGVEENQGFEPLPAGEYPFVIENAEPVVKPESGATMVKVSLCVESGEYEGRKVFNYFNVLNKSEKAEQIGKGQLKAFLNSIEGINPKTIKLEDLEGREVVAELSVKEDKEYGKQNIIKRWGSREDKPKVTAKSLLAKREPKIDEVVNNDNMPW